MNQYKNSLQLPKDIVYKEMLIYLFGQREAVIQNFTSLLDFSDTQILLQGKQNKLQVMGEALRITNYTKDEIRIEGRITETQFMEQ